MSLHRCRCATGLERRATKYVSLEALRISFLGGAMLGVLPFKTQVCYVKAFCLVTAKHQPAFTASIPSLTFFGCGASSSIYGNKTEHDQQCKAQSGMSIGKHSDAAGGLNSNNPTVRVGNICGKPCHYPGTVV